MGSRLCGCCSRSEPAEPLLPKGRYGVGWKAVGTPPFMSIVYDRAAEKIVPKQTTGIWTR